MKKILISSTDCMMYLFLLPHVNALSKQGYSVDVACTSAEEYMEEGYDDFIRDHLPSGSRYFQLSSARSPYSWRNYLGYKQLRDIMEDGAYDLVWTNEPVMGVITRLAAQKFRSKGLKVLYLAHGFHFFQGAPLINWIYYPVEKVCSLITDLMVMINWEDFYFSKKHFNRPVRRIDGIGFDVSKYSDVSVDFASKRRDIGVGPDNILLLSVGELMTRKNHEAIIKALAVVDDPNIKYVICGVGGRKVFLQALAEKLGVDDSLEFIGQRYDIPELLKVADIFAHPSKREGLGIATLEAMAAGLPVVTSNIQGIKDYSIDGETGFSLDPNDVLGYASAIQKLIDDPSLRRSMGEKNVNSVKKWSIENSTSQLTSIINELMSGS
jgi:glycosyltransferase involved in cell wall biosynthesis